MPETDEVQQVREGGGGAYNPFKAVPHISLIFTLTDITSRFDAKVMSSRVIDSLEDKCKNKCVRRHLFLHLFTFILHK